MDHNYKPKLLKLLMLAVGALIAVVIIVELWHEGEAVLSTMY